MGEYAKRKSDGQEVKIGTCKLPRKWMTRVEVLL